jgi:hypothetical protein
MPEWFAKLITEHGLTAPGVLLLMTGAIAVLWRERMHWLNQYIAQLKEQAELTQKHADQIAEITKATERLIDLSRRGDG